MNFAQICLKNAVGALNLSGRVLHGAGVDKPGLDQDVLRRAAQRRAGLDDFGAWAFDEPLERLLDSYRREAHLTLLGRITVRELVISLLENLLHLEDERSRLSAVEAQTISAPVFIIGLPRTGTTLLHGLMSEDCDNRVPRTWEVMHPADFPNTPEGNERARKRTAARLAWAERLAPEFRRIHPIAPELAQECIAMTAPVFMSIQFHTTHNVASYQDWLESDDQALGYAFHHRLLQHLQARRPGDRWVLKAPGHLFALQALLEKYPDAKIIQTHRDPLRVMASMASHATVLRRAFSDTVDAERVAADWTDRWARALDHFLEVRDRAAPEQFLDVDYDDIDRSPVGTMERIYDFLGWTYTDASRGAMTRFLDANPKHKHGVHHYSLEQYGLNRAVEIERFGRYCERFDISVQEP